MSIVGVKNAEVLLHILQKVKKNRKTIENNDFAILFVGHRVYGGSESNTQKHIENSTFLRHRRTGLLRKSNPPLYRTGADLLICHTGLGNSPNTS